MLLRNFHITLASVFTVTPLFSSIVKEHNAPNILSIMADQHPHRKINRINRHPY